MHVYFESQAFNSYAAAAAAVCVHVCVCLYAISTARSDCKHSSGAAAAVAVVVFKSCEFRITSSSQQPHVIKWIIDMIYREARASKPPAFHDFNQAHRRRTLVVCLFLSSPCHAVIVTLARYYIAERGAMSTIFVEWQFGFSSVLKGCRAAADVVDDDVGFTA